MIICSTTGMRKLRHLYSKYKEYILYVIFGVLTTLVSWGSFYVCAHLFKISVVPANIISWILAVACAYLTNRTWVFDSKANGFRMIFKEASEFVAGRLVTLGLETLLLWLTVDLAHWNDMLMKILVSILVVVLNYIFNKVIVFKK